MIPMDTETLQPTASLVASHSGSPTIGLPHHRARVYEAKLMATSATMPTMAGSKTPRTARSAWTRPVAAGRSAQPTA